MTGLLFVAHVWNLSYALKHLIFPKNFPKKAKIWKSYFCLIQEELKYCSVRKQQAIKMTRQISPPTLGKGLPKAGQGSQSTHWGDYLLFSIHLSVVRGCHVSKLKHTLRGYELNWLIKTTKTRNSPSLLFLINNCLSKDLMKYLLPEHLEFSS